MKPLRYSEAAPSAELSPYVSAFWTFEIAADAPLPFVHHVWPDGCVSLVAGGGFAAIAGPTTEARRIPITEPDIIRGIRFRPEAGATVVGIPAEKLRGNRFVIEPVDDVHAWLAARPLPPLDRVVRDAVDVIRETRGGLPIAGVAERVGMSERQLQRRFRRAVGLTPKEFARIRRFRSAIGAVLQGRVEWSRVACEFGFADQAHLSREFAEISGFAPVAFEERIETMAHENVTP
jgi:AraC-like DNA-binding protein